MGYTAERGGGVGTMRAHMYEDGMNAPAAKHSYSSTFSTRNDSRCKGDQQYVGLTAIGRRIVAAQAFPSRWRRGHVGRSLANDHPNALLVLSTPLHPLQPTQPLSRKSPAPSHTIQCPWNHAPALSWFPSCRAHSTANPVPQPAAVHIATPQHSPLGFTDTTAGMYVS